MASGVEWGNSSFACAFRILLPQSREVQVNEFVELFTTCHLRCTDSAVEGCEYPAWTSSDISAERVVTPSTTLAISIAMRHLADWQRTSNNTRWAVILPWPMAGWPLNRPWLIYEGFLSCLRSISLARSDLEIRRWPQTLSK